MRAALAKDYVPWYDKLGVCFLGTESFSGAAGYLVGAALGSVGGMTGLSVRDEEGGISRSMSGEGIRTRERLYWTKTVEGPGVGGDKKCEKRRGCSHSGS